MNPDLLPWLPPDARLVVEFGCGTGELAAAYKRLNPHGTYVGTEANADAARVAAGRLDRVVVGDAERLDLGLPAASVGCLVYGDILEHMVDPWSALRRHAEWLAPDGVVVACVPNVQHWSVLHGLLSGQWRYQDQGLLDRTHLRFFTLDGVTELFHSAGLEVVDTLARKAVGPEPGPFLRHLETAVRALGIEPALFAARAEAVQYVVRAVPRGRPVRRLLVQSVCGVPEISAVRVEEPNGFCATIPGVRAVTQADRFVDFRTARPGEEKILILQRVVLDPAQEAAAVRRFLDQGYLLIAEMDDDPAYWPKHAAGRHFTFRCCHAVQTTTEPLAAVLREYNPNVAAFANQLAELPPPRQYADGPPTVFFGAINREDDWRPLMPTLNRVLSELGDRVRVRVVFDRPFFDALETPHKAFEPWCSYERYHAVLRECDVGFLPLADTRFNGMKSDLKFLQCAAHGVAALASPPAYGDSIADGETGLLFRDESEMADRLRGLVLDSGLRHRLAERAYGWVRDRRMLAQHFRPRYEWYVKLRDQLPRLTEELLERAPEVFAG